MKISNIKRLIPIAHKVGVTVRLVGHHGLGKSNVVAQVAEELFDGNIVNVFCSQNDVGDLVGLADFQTDSKGNKVATKFFKPNWWPRDPKSKGIVFLDEISRARPDVQQAVFQLALSKELQGEKLPSGWTVVVADNPDTENYKTEQMQDEAWLDRFLHVKFNPSAEEFFTYAKERKFDTDLLNFLQTNEEVLSNQKLKDFTIDRLPSRRSWEVVAKLISIGLETSDEMFLEAVGGMVGIENATRLRAYYEQNRNKPFTGEQILTNYPKYRQQLKDYCDMTTGRPDLVNITATNLTDFLFTKDKLTEKEKANLNDFCDDIPMDVGYGFFINTMDITRDGKQMCFDVNRVLDDNKRWDDIIRNKKHLGLIKTEATADGK